MRVARSSAFTSPRAPCTASRILGERRASLGPHLVQGQRALAGAVVHADHVLQVRRLGADLRDLGGLRRVRDEDDLGLAVVQDVEDLGRR